MTMKLQTGEISQWVDVLGDFAPEYTAIKATTPLNFFRLKGRTTSMISSNVECIPNLFYAVYSPLEERYYYKQYHGYDLDTIFFYRPTLTFSGEDEAVRVLRRYIQDGNVYVLFTAEQIADTTAMLKRLWKSHFVNEGKLDYRIFIEILKLSLEYEDYKDYGKSLTGFMTICKKYESSIREWWDKAYAKTVETNSSAPDQ